MELEKAIEILELNIKSVGTKMPTDTLQAVKLLVEAGKRVKAHRASSLTDAHILLLGED